MRLHTHTHTRHMCAYINTSTHRHRKKCYTHTTHIHTHAHTHSHTHTHTRMSRNTVQTSNTAIPTMLGVSLAASGDPQPESKQKVAYDVMTNTYRHLIILLAR